MIAWPFDSKFAFFNYLVVTTTTWLEIFYFSWGLFGFPTAVDMTINRKEHRNISMTILTRFFHLSHSSANAKKWESEFQTLKNNNARLTAALQESAINVEKWKEQLNNYKEDNQRLRKKVSVQLLRYVSQLKLEYDNVCLLWWPLVWKSLLLAFAIYLFHTRFLVNISDMRFYWAYLVIFNTFISNNEWQFSFLYIELTIVLFHIYQRLTNSQATNRLSESFLFTNYIKIVYVSIWDWVVSWR